MNQKIEQLIVEYVAAYPVRHHTSTKWKKPLVGFAKANNPKFDILKESVRATHLTPLELLKSGESVIAFFLAFDEGVARSNKEGYYASKEWSVAYIETNSLINDLSNYLIDYLQDQNYEAATVPATHNFDEETLMSDWSHRHVAEIAGLGKLGLNNMLITDNGCAGRVGSVVTALNLEASEVPEGDRCLFLRDGTCGVCVKRCPMNAFEEGYDRFKCYEILLENDAYHDDLGLTDVCGKCCSALPCTYRNPCK